jgi:sodium/hydrogen antiporter
VAPGAELIKALAEITLALVLFSDASRIGLHHLRADLACACGCSVWDCR